MGIDPADAINAQLREFRIKHGFEPEEVKVPRWAFEWCRSYLDRKRTYEAMLFPATVKWGPGEQTSHAMAQTLDWGGGVKLVPMG